MWACSDPICWCDPQSSPTGSWTLCKKLYATPRKITYDDVIYNVVKMEKVLNDYNRRNSLMLSTEARKDHLESKTVENLLRNN